MTSNNESSRTPANPSSYSKRILPRTSIGQVSWVGNKPKSPIPATLHVAVAKLSRFESAGPTAHYMLPFSFYRDIVLEVHRAEVRSGDVY